eukprot:1142565-Pelagomonas_calceolata.AAC.3
MIIEEWALQFFKKAGLQPATKEKKQRKVYAGQRPRALSEGPLTGKLEASPEACYYLNCSTH